MPKKLKVGFDLDGVILYNPIRFVRGIAKSVKFIKPIIFKQKKEPFYYPKSGLEKFIWRLLHKTSFRLNDGFSQIKEMSDQGLIETYLITGRYRMLEDDFKKWLKFIKADKVFKKSYFNRENLQPNDFKGQLIKNLDLDYYVEDNWDIVEKLDSHTATQILWITNFLDKRIRYPYKFNNLAEVRDYLLRQLKSK